MPRLQQYSARTAGEYLAQNREALQQVLGAEENPPDQNQHKSDRRLQRVQQSRMLVDRLPIARQTLQAEQRSVIGAPDGEIPTRSVPEPAQQHGQHEIAVRQD